MKKWENDELELAVKLLKNGASYEEVGAQLHRTSKSVSVFLSKKGVSLLSLLRENRSCRVCEGQFKASKSSRKYTCSDACLEMFSTRTRTGPKNKERGECSVCHKKIQSRNKLFCGGKCHGIHKQSIIFQKIENGDTSYPARSVRKYLIHKHGNQCMECGWNKVNEKSGVVPIQLDHIDGNSDNNALNNVRLLCPNCHSLTPNYGSLNRMGRLSKRNQTKKEYYHRTKHIGV